MTSSPSWITVSPSAPAEGIIERRAARLAQGAPRESRASHLGNIQTALLRRITPATTLSLGPAGYLASPGPGHPAENCCCGRDGIRERRGDRSGGRRSDRYLG